MYPPKDTGLVKRKAVEEINMRRGEGGRRGRRRRREMGWEKISVQDVYRLFVQNNALELGRDSVLPCHIINSNSLKYQLIFCKSKIISPPTLKSSKTHFLKSKCILREEDVSGTGGRQRKGKKWKNKKEKAFNLS